MRRQFVQVPRSRGSKEVSRSCDDSVKPPPPFESFLTLGIEGIATDGPLRIAQNTF